MKYCDYDFSQIEEECILDYISSQNKPCLGVRGQSVEGNRNDWASFMCSSVISLGIVKFCFSGVSFAVTQQELAMQKNDRKPCKALRLHQFIFLLPEHLFQDAKPCLASHKQHLPHLLLLIFLSFIRCVLHLALCCQVNVAFTSLHRECK